MFVARKSFLKKTTSTFFFVVLLPHLCVLFAQTASTRQDEQRQIRLEICAFLGTSLYQKLISDRGYRPSDAFKLRLKFERPPSSPHDKIVVVEIREDVGRLSEIVKRGGVVKLGKWMKTSALPTIDDVKQLEGDEVVATIQIGNAPPIAAQMRISSAKLENDGSGALLSLVEAKQSA